MNIEVKLLYPFSVANSNGEHMDQAELFTILAETILLPDHPLQHSI